MKNAPCERNVVKRRASGRLSANKSKTMIEFVIGGARSGKSAYAQTTAEAMDGNLTYIATAEAKDDEMLERIKRHQQERGQRWTLLEEPLFLSNTINNFSDKDVILVDCLTLWLTNWLCSENTDGWTNEKQDFLKQLTQSPASWFLVSNEVGLGVTPMGELSRQFVDESGTLHQQLAEVADRVTLVMFGLPQTLKS
jgi:adenosylcobinamide kinase/adenosylcobinamide-phosphate guanylyltransferase